MSLYKSDITKYSFDEWGKRNPTILCIKKHMDSPDSHPELTFTSRLSDQAGTKNEVSYLFLGLLNKSHILVT